MIIGAHGDEQEEAKTVITGVYFLQGCKLIIREREKKNMEGTNDFVFLSFKLVTGAGRRELHRSEPFFPHENIWSLESLMGGGRLPR